MSQQQSYYAHNEEYAEFLANWDANFYAKYSDTLKRWMLVAASAR